jgi:chromosome segregation ATPase
MTPTTETLDSLDARIRSAEELVTRTTSMLHEARRVRERLEDERLRARGRVAEGDVTAGPDLDRIRAAFMAARHEEQDAQNALQEAQAKVPDVRAARDQAEVRVVAESLGAVLEVRQALAGQLEAQVAALAATARLYTAAVAESVGLGRLAGVEVVHPTMDAFAARRLLAVIRPALPTEFPYSVSHVREGLLPESDAEATKSLHQLVARMRGDRT